MMNEFPENHKAGFVNIIGQPNVGKSTFVNNFTEVKLNIITSKPQTTRHRILAILNDEEHQIILSDSPGIIDTPHYAMHEKMNEFAWSGIEDADILLYYADVWQEPQLTQMHIDQLQKVEGHVYFILNKIDQKPPEEVEELYQTWKKLYKFDRSFKISALHKEGIEDVYEAILKDMPIHPPYYPKDQLTDKTERFIVSEIIREKILELYKKEIPYAAEVNVHWYKQDESHDPPILNIGADIYVERDTQKGIVVGKGGKMINQLGRLARKEIEEMVGQQIYLELRVKVRKNWRHNDDDLRHFGYDL